MKDNSHSSIKTKHTSWSEDKKTLSKKDILAFQRRVYSFYQKNNRNDLPWRKTKNPYRILVSEVMLQQTQVSRVLEKYKSFLHNFPTIQSLEHAPLKDVLKVWQGLGYNRRALLLKKCAIEITRHYKGKFPKDFKALQSLSGIGQSTAGALMAFAYNTAHIFIETNIRSVYIHEFFPRSKNIDDKKIISLIEQTIDIKNPREWYWALMDYGVHLKKKFKNPSTKSKHHATQSKFEGSDRKIRGEIIKILTEKNKITKTNLRKKLGIPQSRYEIILHKLIKENLIEKTNTYISIKN